MLAGQQQASTVRSPVAVRRRVATTAAGASPVGNINGTATGWGSGIFAAAAAGDSAEAAGLAAATPMATDTTAPLVDSRHAMDAAADRASNVFALMTGRGRGRTATRGGRGGGTGRAVKEGGNDCGNCRRLQHKKTVNGRMVPVKCTDGPSLHNTECSRSGQTPHILPKSGQAAKTFKGAKK